MKNIMEPYRRTLQLSLADTSVEAPEQPRLSCREMRPATVGSYRLL